VEFYDQSILAFQIAVILFCKITAFRIISFPSDIGMDISGIFAVITSLLPKNTCGKRKLGWEK